MAVPAFQSWGSYNARLSGDAAGTPGAPASIASGDILLLVIEDAGTDSSTSLPTVSGGTETWTAHPDSPKPSSGGTRLFLYWARASQASPTMPSVSGGNNHTFSRVGRFTGGTTSDTPWVGSEYSSATNSVADFTLGGFNTGGADRLCVFIISSGFNGTNSTRFSAWANSSLGSVTEIHDQVDTIGNGGGFGAMTGTMVTAGTVGNFTVTEGFLGHGAIAIALAPPQPTGPTPASIVRTRAQGDLKVNPTLKPASLDRTRALGSPKTNPTLVVSALTRTRALGDPTLSVGFTLSPAALVRTRAQGDLIISPQILLGALIRTRAQGSPTFNPTTFVSSLARTRALGDLTVTSGIIINLASLPRSRALGDIIISPSAVISALTRTRVLGTPTANPQIVVSSVVRSRVLGQPTVSTPGGGTLPYAGYEETHHHLRSG